MVAKARGHLRDIAARAACHGQERAGEARSQQGQPARCATDEPERWDFKAGHHGYHALERAMDTPRLSADWTDVVYPDPVARE